MLLLFPTATNLATTTRLTLFSQPNLYHRRLKNGSNHNNYLSTTDRSVNDDDDSLAFFLPPPQ